MYKLHLILKYLRKRRIAWVSLIAVMLCTAMVLVVISVMGGWLRMFRESFHGLTGDVIVQGESMVGFPHYEEIIRRVERLPEVEAAVPTLETYGLVNFNNRVKKGVRVLGIPIDKIGQVNRFHESLNLQYQEPTSQGLAPPKASFDLLPNVEYERLLPNSPSPVRDWPGMIVGLGVVGGGKNESGEIERPGGLYEAWAKLTVLGIDADSSNVNIREDKSERRYWVVDDSRTKIWQYDNMYVYVPFHVLQVDLRMEAIDGQPARTNDIQIKLKDGVDLKLARDKIATIVDDVMMNANPKGLDLDFPYSVETWEETQALYLGAIEKEKVLVTMLFGVISVVAVFLIFCIFYMIVVEKTKDIGIVKSVGATSQGVAGIFLGYGLAIGVVGGGFGLLAAYLIVRNINEIHTWLGNQMGIVMWDPAVYAFDTIPNTMDPTEVTIIVAVAVIASVIGALVPALRAARMNPVEALRWE